MAPMNTILSSPTASLKSTLPPRSDSDELADILPTAQATFGEFLPSNAKLRSSSVLERDPCWRTINDIKLGLEKKLQRNVAFWPLEEPRERCPEGFVRLYYDCSCGIEMTLDVVSNSPTETADSSVGPINKTATLALLCLMPFAVAIEGMVTICAAINQLSGIVSASPGLFYTMVENTKYVFRRCADRLRGRVVGKLGSNPAHHAPPRPQLGNYGFGGISGGAMYAFWCVRYNDVYEILKEIPVPSNMSDGEFFGKLRSYYNQFRGIKRLLNLNYICNIRYVSVGLRYPSQTVSVILRMPYS
ncbi:hypothetical protein ABW19_dt0208592 [Dactylella cylindrospora]|nr:hypothetical protein ABW19_dt0208592 [Dactylella cylindrospora]